MEENLPVVRENAKAPANEKNAGSSTNKDNSTKLTAMYRVWHIPKY